MSRLGDIRARKPRVFILHAHLVLGTRYRHEVFAARRLKHLEEIIHAARADFGTEEFPDQARHYWRTNRLWPGCYFAGSFGRAPTTVLRQYTGQQDLPA